MLRDTFVIFRAQISYGPRWQVNIPMASIWRGLLLMRIGWSCLLWLRHPTVWVILIGVSGGARGSPGPVLVLDGSNAQVNIPMASIWIGLLLMRIGWRWRWKSSWCKPVFWFTILRSSPAEWFACSSSLNEMCIAAFELVITGHKRQLWNALGEEAEAE